MASPETGEQPPTVTGKLESPSGDRAIEVRPASRFSLYVSFEAAPPEDGAEFAALTKEIEAATHRLGSCQFIANGAGTGNRGPDGGVIFPDDVYDVESLVLRNKFVDIDASFRNLPLVLQQKEGIWDEFKRLTDDVTYDFGVYRQFFDSEDRKYLDEPEDVRAGAQRALLHTVGRQFLAYFQESVDRLDELVIEYSREEHQRHGFYFRNHTWQFIMLSALMARTNLKPRGYIGDSEMLAMLYENDYRGDWVFPKLLHKYPVETIASQAVRNRRQIVPAELRRVRQQLDARPFRFLSVACGSAVEVVDLIRDCDDPEGLDIALLDQDTHALSEATAGLAAVAKERGCSRASPI